MKIYPPMLDKETISTGEARVYNALRLAASAPQAAGWRVFHSLNIKTSVNAGETEADFVIVAPNLGILLIEVKACKTMSFDGQVWKLGTKSETRGPFNQVSNAMWRTKNFLKSRGLVTEKIPFYRVVWFTELSRSDIKLGIEFSEFDMLSHEDFSSPIAARLKSVILKQREISKFSDSSVPSQRIVDQIAQTLLPKFEAKHVPAPAEIEKELSNFLKIALEYQLAAYNAVHEMRHSIIDALAGTGKTFLAEHAARELAKADQKTLFLCHNKLLAEHLVRELPGVGNLRVVTLAALMVEVSGLTPPDDDADEWWRKTLPDAANIAANLLSDDERFDAAVVDEAQDLGDVGQIMFVDAMLRGGLRNSHKVIVFGDFENQGIFADGENARQNWLESLEIERALNLGFNVNCRNSPRVGEIIESELSMSPSWSGFRRKDSLGEIQRLIYNPGDELLQLFEHMLKRARTRHGDSEIVVLTTSPGRLEELLSESKSKATRLGEQRQANRIRWGTPYQFKGLETSCIIMVEFDWLAPKSWDTFYVSSTRTTGDFYYLIPTKLHEFISKGK